MAIPTARVSGPRISGKPASGYFQAIQAVMHVVLEQALLSVKQKCRAEDRRALIIMLKDDEAIVYERCDAALIRDKASSSLSEYS